MQELDRIPGLIAKHLTKELSAAEQRELNAWLAQSDWNRQYFREVTADGFLPQLMKEYNSIDGAGQHVNEYLGRIGLAGQVKTMRAVGWIKYVAAAAVFIAGVAGVYWWNQQHTKQTTIAQHTRSTSTSDIPPGHDGAVLTLADGKTVVLDSAAAGELATQGNARVVLSHGKLAYTPQRNEKPPSDIVYYNQLATPRGRKFRITLPDGSNVWLNAASSLRYPVQFKGSERRVQITGEAYFEVAHNPAKPFIVQVALPNNTGAEVRVLGTHFNVMAYTSEEVMKTTLLEGRVAVRTLNNAGQPTPGNAGQRTTDNEQRPTILSPGQQSSVTLSLSKGASKEIAVTDDVDTDQVIAWKNDLLSFNHADIKTLMRSIERWYDVDVVYSGNLPQRTFTGKFPSNISLTQLLTILDVNNINHTLEGHVLTIKP